MPSEGDASIAGVGALGPASTPRPGRPVPLVDAGRCTGCGRCVAVCDEHLLSLERQGWEKSAVLHDADRCTGCRRCAYNCPFHAITMHTRAASTAGPSAG
jgi:ferredoxin